jgi:hypothetical protein
LATSGSFTGDPVKDFGTAVLDAAVADTGFSSAGESACCGLVQAVPASNIAPTTARHTKGATTERR